MPLTLDLDGAHAGAGRETRTLSQGTLSIGRAPGNDWVLADPDRQLSKTHCVIVAAGGRYLLTDLSTNGVFLNGAAERMARESQIELTDGDEFRIGEYVVRVTETRAFATPAASRFPDAAAPFAPGGGARSDPFAGPYSGPYAGPEDLSPDPLDDAFAMPSASPFVHPIAAPPPQALRTHDPFDLADEPTPARRIDPDDSLFNGIKPAENWQGPSQADNVDAQNHAFAAPKPIMPVDLDDLDIDALLGDTPPGQPAPTPPAPAPSQARGPAPFASPAFAPPASAPFAPTPFTPTPSTPTPFTPKPSTPAQPAPTAPTVFTGHSATQDDGLAPPTARQSGPFDFEAEPPPPAPLRPPQQAAAPTAPAPDVPGPDAAKLLAAFLEGAGVPELALGPDPERAMRDAGAVFQAMVDGIRQVLISRASVKNEFRVEQTMLRVRDNNALKFSVTTEDAIAALLQPSRPGYKPPLDATIEAFDDVRSHEMAVMAGVQTALMGLLKRFEPTALEKRLEPGILGNIVPAARKARTWELFCTTYNAIAAEAQEDFQSVFGREFARAYNAQMQKL